MRKLYQEYLCGGHWEKADQVLADGRAALTAGNAEGARRAIDDLEPWQFVSRFGARMPPRAFGDRVRVDSRPGTL